VLRHKWQQHKHRTGKEKHRKNNTCEHKTHGLSSTRDGARGRRLIRFRERQGGIGNTRRRKGRGGSKIVIAYLQGKRGTLSRRRCVPSEARCCMHAQGRRRQNCKDIRSRWACVERGVSTLRLLLRNEERAIVQGTHAKHGGKPRNRTSYICRHPPERYTGIKSTSGGLRLHGQTS